MSRQTSESEAEAARFSVGFARDCGHLAAASALVAALGAYPFIRFVYGADWVGAVAPFVLLSLASIATAVQSPLQFFITRIGRPAQLGALAILTVIVNVGVTVPLIIALGIVGAAVGTLVAYSFFLAGTLLLVKRARPELAVREVLRRPRRGDLIVEYAWRLRLRGLRP